MSKTSSPSSGPRKKSPKSNSKENIVNGADTPSPSHGTGKIQVVVRLRPINEREKEHGTLPVVTASSQDKTVTVVRGTGRRQARSSYAFDNVFSAFTTQEEVFDATLRPILRDVMMGYESTVFAYGQTGTGKTHTMEGELSSPELHGIIPRSAKNIFDTLNQPEYHSHTVFASCLEIYNEELCDLFADEEQRKNTQVVIMEGKDGICCRGQVQMEVRSAEDVLALMNKAQEFRQIGETKMNKQSSRSHCIFTLQVNAQKTLSDGNTLEVHGKLHLVDLAGSECAKTAAGRGTAVKRERERSNINRSLLTLGRVILMLKEQTDNSKKGSHVRIPYRDSKLTRLLQKSLGGKCKTLVIATLSPSVVSIEESVSTLNYAQSANGIVNKPVATSYLSINTNGSGPPPTDPSGGEGGNSLEHWYEMECRLQYMETQVQEAQAALARNHMVQQEIVNRAEKAEKALALMEEKYAEAALEVKQLNKVVKAERDKLEAIKVVLADTQLELKKTSAVLDATQANEVTLTAEANALIETLEESLKDGDELHQALLDTRDADVKRRLATRQFHSATVSVLENIMTTLNKLNEKEKLYCDEMLESAEKENRINHSSLNTSLGLVKDINFRVKELTSTIKSHAQDENGVLPLLSQLSSDIEGGIHQSEDFLRDGEQVLSSSISRAHKQLEQQSSDLKEMDLQYLQLTQKLLSSIELNSTSSRDKIIGMVHFVTDAISNVRDANLETRTALGSVISKLDTNCTEAANHIEMVSKSHSVTMNNAIETFAKGMKHIEEMKSELGKQVDFFGNEGSQHLSSIDTQKSMLTSHRESIVKASQEQVLLKEQFLVTVLDGVRDLVNKQMNLFSDKQQEHLSNFKDGTEDILEKNSVIGSSADRLVQEVCTVNQSLSNHAEIANKNDYEMKTVAEAAKAAFVNVCDTSKSQQGTIKTYTGQGHRHMKELSSQDEKVGDICEMMHVEKDNVIKSVDTMTQEEMANVSKLTNASNRRVEYTMESLITSVSSNLESMEKPRKEVVANVTGKLDSVLRTVDEGKAQVETSIVQQCEVADELTRDVESKHNDHNVQLAKRCRLEFDACKESIIERAKGHYDVSSVELLSSVTNASSTKGDINYFTTNTMEFDKEVPLIPERTSFIYSAELSATPSVDSIVKNI